MAVKPASAMISRRRLYSNYTGGGREYWLHYGSYVMSVIPYIDTGTLYRAETILKTA